MIILEKKSRPADLWPVLLGVALVAGFFVAHQAWATGFFTSGFGPTGAVLLYGAILTALVPPVVGSLHVNRRTELVVLLATAVFWTDAAASFYFAFPFDFSHLAAVVPGPATFLFNWVSNDLARVLIGLALVGAAAFIPFFTLQYFQSGRTHSRLGQST